MHESLINYFVLPFYNFVCMFSPKVLTIVCLFHLSETIFGKVHCFILLPKKKKKKIIVMIRVNRLEATVHFICYWFIFVSK